VRDIYVGGRKRRGGVLGREGERGLGGEEKYGYWREIDGM